MNRMLSKGENLEIKIKDKYFNFEVEDVESHKLTLIKKENLTEKIQLNVSKMEMFLDPSI